MFSDKSRSYFFLGICRDSKSISPCPFREISTCPHDPESAIEMPSSSLGWICRDKIFRSKLRHDPCLASTPLFFQTFWIQTYGIFFESETIVATISHFNSLVDGFSTNQFKVAFEHVTCHMRVNMGEE